MVQKYGYLPIENSILMNIVISVGFAVFVPVLAAILPVINVLETPLREALDHKQSRTKALKIDIRRASDWDGGRLGFGVVCAIFGSSLFFILPDSILTMNGSVVLSLMFSILLGLLAGLILLSFNFMFFFERAVY